MTDQELNTGPGPDRRPGIEEEAPRFPTELVEELEILRPDFDRRGNAALQRLAEKNYDVALGLNEYYAGAVSIMSQQPHIVEYCPRDSTEARFASRASTERWLKKCTGRAVFLLLHRGQGGLADHRLAGYGWSGLASETVRDEYPITTAYRIGAEDRRKQLSKDLVQVVVSTTWARFAGGHGIGLETWRSNPAFKAYKQLGFLVLESLSSDGPQWRPTLDRFATDGLESDTRVRMGYPKHLFD